MIPTSMMRGNLLRNGQTEGWERFPVVLLVPSELCSVDLNDKNTPARGFSALGDLW